MPRTSPNGGRLPAYQSADFSDGATEYILDMMGGNSTQPIQMPGREFEYDEAGRSLEAEAFMREPVVIEVTEPADENAPPMTFVGVNGHQAWLPRGVAVRVPRYFVERLAASHEDRIKQSEQRDPNVMDGYVTTKVKRQAYPFTVISDPNPKGRQWLMRMTREGT